MKQDMRDAFFEELIVCAKKNTRVVFLTADHGTQALKKFQIRMPNRYYNMGIAEQNMIGVAAGLAASGKIVFVFGITPFVSLRVLEQLSMDIAAMNLPVNIISIGAGFTYSVDGPTHHGLQDISAIASIPNITIYNSSDPANTKKFVHMAIKNEKPHYIRIEKECLFPLSRIMEKTNGFSFIKKNRKNILILTTGALIHKLLEYLDKSERAIQRQVSLIDVYKLKPIENKLLDEIKKYKKLLIVEEGYSSGLAKEIVFQLALNGSVPLVKICAIKEEFVFKYDTRAKLIEKNLLNSSKFINIIKELIISK